MATAPQINLRDGSGDTAQELVFTTNLEFITITGTIDANTVALQVSVNGSVFATDNTLVALDGTNFTFPNPASFPDGFQLELGLNTIAFRAVDIVGSVSPISTVSITRVAAIEAGEGLIPTGVSVRRRRDAVDILVAAPLLSDHKGTDQNPTDYEFRGYNFYASSSEGGAGSAYFKLNEALITEASTIFDERLIELDSSEVVFPNDGSEVRIRVTQQDVFGQETSANLDRLVNVGLTGSELKFTQTLSIRELNEFIFFRHNRGGGTGQTNADQFVDVDTIEPLYYVVAGVFFDSFTNEEFETPFSQEVLGLPIVIDTAIRDLPGRSQLQITLGFVAAIQRVEQEITLIPGSTTRDVSIDPFASEAERLWFMIDFVHRSQSFLTLLQIDDANQDGISDAVATSAYKQAIKSALGLATDTAVQTLIDSQFDKLAGNFTRTRLNGRPAVGQVVFYTTTRPTADVTIPSGTVVSSTPDEINGIFSTRFVVGGTFVLSAINADAFFNFATQRYEIVADITAESVGSNGNRPAGSIVNISSPLGTFQVTNTEATVFGSDRESNTDLAVRSQLAFVSVDTGTEGGYAATAAEQIGIIKSKIVKSGDELMMRDWDEVRLKHIGGKVDIWVQGLRERTVTERFAFTFETARDIRCQIIDTANLIFRVLDTRVTVDTPLVEILDNSAQGLGVRNGTVGADYDLTGVLILDYETFQLSTAVAQPTTNFDDVVIADYRFRAVNQHTFLLQPVRRVTALTGEVSGALPVTQFQLFKTDDPLLEGESTIAKDYLVIEQVGGVPSGVTIPVNDEQHVMIGFFEERLQSIGVNTATVRVFTEDRVTEFAGPGSATPDYEIIEGTATTPARVVRTATSTILSGQTVSIDYDHDENFTVTYVINDLLQQLQQTVDRRRHVTADVLVKQAVLNSVELETTIQLNQGATKDTVDPLIRSNVSVELNTKLIGQGSAQSDLINAIDSTPGVDFQVLPLARMGYADGSRKMREDVRSSAARLSTLDIGGSQVFILTNPLRFPTIEGGGTETEHKGVFQDDIAMTLSSSLTNVGEFINQAYIIGADGASVAGYSDDATLIVAGFTLPDAIVAERVRRTANHAVVSLSGSGTPPDAPENHAYAVSYTVYNDRGPHDLVASSVEFLDLGNLTLTFREGT